MKSSWNNLLAKTKRVYDQFTFSLNDCQSTQEAVLLKILNNSKNTEFGKKYSFSRISNVSQFQSAIPLQSYESLSEWIERILRNNEPHLLFDGLPLAFELTSATSAGAKWIPYSKESFFEFRMALFPWLHDVIKNFPEIKEGKAYWAISPVTRKVQYTPHGIPVGVSDVAYFGEELSKELLQTLAVDPALGGIQNASEWKQRTLEALKQCSELSFISAWSPTFILELIDKTKLNWPQLKLISCWTDGFAKSSAKRLKEMFPDVTIQPKGLLATEGVVSIPWSHASASALAIQSGFFEFIDSNNRIFLPEEVVKGDEYRVLITNSSGFYRYDLGDLIRITGWVGSTPTLQLVGRNHTSDLCGEKLHETFVEQVLDTVLGDKRGFAMVVPISESKAHYALVLDKKEIQEEGSLALRLDEALSENPHYAYARKLGQLSEIQVILAESPRDKLFDGRISSTQKYTALNTKNGQEFLNRLFL